MKASLGRVAVIVQARMTSTRLHGKVLRKLGDRTVLEQVLARCFGIPGADVVCCATVEGAEGDEIAAVASRTGARVFRGDREDVLDRYDQAAHVLDADVVLRVTSDCPLIDPAVCGQVLDLFASEHADYACNNMPPSWPHGLDCEAISVGWLHRAASEATMPSDREHVTPFIRGHPEAIRVNLEGPGGKAALQRWTLDYEEDLTFLSEVYKRLPSGSSGWAYRIPLRILAVEPRLLQLNIAYAR
jgi:spore coat polysaccharide biosynthesis protein SpsF